ncbi:DUF1269 domain-containing protein [Amycolatopsis sp. K13G38]|uniref:DUF1269 domain-containing protein n=1 Tax=Amycolatopsis acididurans TaxID=2724524 RepID=A0ABX1J241_9PSEU|nr:DUF1269 domain-containing protein [Amycolatopsis acididurans]NKQ52336.1 DUF1269 domain-containing protein [Amycolatopsis acididurans]
MGTLSVWKFDSAAGAENALALLSRLQKEQLITVTDAAFVSWPEDRKRPRTKELGKLTGTGALGGGFWGFLFGLIFFVPFLGMAVGAAVGALAGSLTHVGIDEDFIREIRRQVVPGTSALFVVTGDVVVDRVLEPFKETGASLITTNLSTEQEEKLREAFAETQEPQQV